MAVTLEELQIRFSASMGGLSSQLRGVKQQLGTISTSAGTASTAISRLAGAAKLFVGALIIRGMVNIGKQSLQMANDVVESESLFAVSMKGMANEARAWSDELSASLGLNAYNLRKNAGTFNTMFKSMGLGTQEAYDMSTGLTSLAEDMASFYNVDPEEMFTKLRAGITGETEPLKRLGIMVDEATTKQYALANGISTTGKELTQTEKLMARYGAIMQQTADAQGDLARTIDSPVNQIRILGNTLDMAKIALGQAFQPIQAVVLPILNSLARAALTAANAIKNFLWALTGFTGVGGAAAEIAGKGAGANEELADSLDKSAESYKKAGGAAKKAAKDAKVGLKAFDEINKLAEEGEKANGGSGGLGEMPEVVQNEAYADALESVNVAMSKAADWLKKVWAAAEPTREALSRLWDSLTGLASVLWDRLVYGYEKFIKPIGTWAVTTALPAFLDMLSSAVNLLSNYISAAQPAWEKFYTKVLVPIGNWTGGAIVAALGWMEGALDSVSTWIDEHPVLFGKIIEGLEAFAAGIMAVYVASTLIKIVTGFFNTLSATIAFIVSPLGAIGLLAAALYLIIDNWDAIKAHALACWAEIQTEWADVSTWFSTTVIEPLKKFFVDGWYTLGLWGEQAWATIAKAWVDVSTWFSETVLEPTKKFFSDVLGAIVRFGIQTWTSIKTAWNAAATWFSENVLEPIKTFFSDVFGAVYRAVLLTWTNIKTAWAGATEWFNNLLQPVKDAIAEIEAAWETVKGFFGSKITQEVEIKYTSSGKPYGGTSGSLEPTVPLPSSSIQKPSSGIQKPSLSLQKFASGGVFQPNRPFLGILGDQRNGRNIEAPETVLRDIFRDEMGKTNITPRIPMGSDLPAQNASVVQQAVEAVLDKLNISLSVDGEQFGRVAVRTINDTQRRAGRLLLEM